MTFNVWLTDDAAKDLEELYDYIGRNDAPEKADNVLARIEEVVSSLEELPERGNHPRELSSLGIRDYRELRFKAYRIIYRIMDDRVYIYCILDGRRDMQSLLQRRLLGG